MSYRKEAPLILFCLLLLTQLVLAEPKSQLIGIEPLFIGSKNTIGSYISYNLTVHNPSDRVYDDLLTIRIIDPTGVEVHKTTVNISIGAHNKSSFVPISDQEYRTVSGFLAKASGTYLVNISSASRVRFLMCEDYYSFNYYAGYNLSSVCGLSTNYYSPISIEVVKYIESLSEAELKASIDGLAKISKDLQEAGNAQAISSTLLAVAAFLLTLLEFHPNKEDLLKKIWKKRTLPVRIAYYTIIVAIALLVTYSLNPVFSPPFEIVQAIGALFLGMSLIAGGYSDGSIDANLYFLGLALLVLAFSALPSLKDLFINLSRKLSAYVSTKLKLDLTYRKNYAMYFLIWALCVIAFHLGHKIFAIGWLNILKAYWVIFLFYSLIAYPDEKNENRK